MIRDDIITKANMKAFLKWLLLNKTDTQDFDKWFTEVMTEREPDSIIDYYNQCNRLLFKLYNEYLPISYIKQNDTSAIYTQMKEYPDTDFHYAMINKELIRDHIIDMSVENYQYTKNIIIQSLIVDNSFIDVWPILDQLGLSISYHDIFVYLANKLGYNETEMANYVYPGTYDPTTMSNEKMYSVLFYRINGQHAPIEDFPISGDYSITKKLSNILNRKVYYYYYTMYTNDASVGYGTYVSNAELEDGDSVTYNGKTYKVRTSNTKESDENYILLDSKKDVYDVLHNVFNSIETGSKHS